jgi:ferredoxin
MASLGRVCGKPLQNCMVIGQWAKRGIEKGQLREVSKQDALEIKREAEAHGMVNWMMNVEATKGQSSCSCCGCCCHAMRSISEFSAPGMMAPPHFLPRLDPAKCVACGKCGKVCPMGAIVFDLEKKADENGRTEERKSFHHLHERCIGCGLCVLACDKKRALAMEAVPDYRMPYRSWFSLIAHAAPGMVGNSLKVWRQRP